LIRLCNQSRAGWSSCQACVYQEFFALMADFSSASGMGRGKRSVWVFACERS